MSADILRAKSRSISSDILRATPLHRSLYWVGWYWRYHSADLSERQQACLYHESQPVVAIDWFLSHSWQTPGYLKVACLLLRFGAQYYLTFGFLALAVIFVLQSSPAIRAPIVHKDGLDFSEGFDWKGDYVDHILGTIL